MSDRMSGGESGEGVYGAAKEAIGAAAEQVRAAAPDTYDAGARAARYVGDSRWYTQRNCKSQQQPPW
jgi:hypothetical protein